MNNISLLLKELNVICEDYERREKLTEYFQFTSDIHRMIYTINTVDDCHHQIRKVTKKQGRVP